MKTLLSCEFNMDTGCVELKYSNGSIISINCTAVEDEVANSRFQRSGLAHLQRSAVLCGIDFEWRSGRIPANRNRDSTVGFRFISKAARGTSMRCCFWRLFTFCQSKQTLPLVALHSISTIVQGAFFANQSEKLVNLLLQTAEKA